LICNTNYQLGQELEEKEEERREIKRMMRVEATDSKVE